MKQVEIKHKSGGIGFIGLLTIVFIVLKLCGVISLSWVWVLAPIWIGLAVPVLILLIIAAISIICGIKNKAFKFQNKEK